MATPQRVCVCVCLWHSSVPSAISVESLGAETCRALGVARRREGACPQAVPSPSESLRLQLFLEEQRVQQRNECVQPQLLAWDWCSQMSCEPQNSARGFQMVCVELSQAEDQRMNQLFDVTFNFFLT